MTNEELQQRLEAIALQLNPRQLKFAIELARGDDQTKEQCYIAAGFAEKGALANSHKLWQRNPSIREYVSVSKQLAVGVAQKELEYDEQAWLADVLGAVEMALGRKEVAVVCFGEEKLVKQTNLGAFAKLSEQLGKRLALFKDRLELDTKDVPKSISADADPQKAAETYQQIMQGG